MYGLGLSCSAASHLLGAWGADLGQMSVWRDAQEEAGEALRRKRPTGRVRVLGADETAYKVKGQKVVVGFVVDAVSGKTLGFEVLFEGDAEAFTKSGLSRTPKSWERRFCSPTTTIPMGWRPPGWARSSSCVSRT